MVEHVHNLPEFQEIIRSSGNKLVVVDFTATWCPPCRAIAPHFEALSHRYQGRVLFLKVDVDEAQDVAKFSSVSSMPTFHFYRNGKRVAEFSGADPSKLDRTVEQHAPSSADVSFSGDGMRLGAPSTGVAANNSDSAAAAQPTFSSREAAAMAAARRLKQLEDASVKGGAGGSSSNGGSNANDSRLKVNEALVRQMVEEMGFSRVRSEKALIFTGNKSLEDAVEWCFEHADDADIDEPLQIVSEPSTSGANEDKDLVTNPQAKGAPKLTKEEVKRRADELFTKARAKREVEGKRDAIEREKDRVKSGKETALAKAKLEQEERRRLVEERRRQKHEDQVDRQRVRDMLQADKEARRKKFRMPNAAPEPVQEEKPQPPSKPPQASASEGKIQFRLPDGSRIEGQFSAEQTMDDVVKFITSSKPDLDSRSIKLSQQYPRKVFSPADYTASLAELNLLPRGALTVSFS